MYHSHVGLDTSDGVFGSLIVKQPLASDPNSSEHRIHGVGSFRSDTV